LVDVPDLADRLHVREDEVRFWLLSLARQGHPLVSDHVPHHPWQFSRKDAEVLVRTFRDFQPWRWEGHGRRTIEEGTIVRTLFVVPVHAEVQVATARLPEHEWDKKTQSHFVSELLGGSDAPAISSELYSHLYPNRWLAVDIVLSQLHYAMDYDRVRLDQDQRRTDVAEAIFALATTAPETVDRAALDLFAWEAPYALSPRTRSRSIGATLLNADTVVIKGGMGVAMERVAAAQFDQAMLTAVCTLGVYVVFISIRPIGEAVDELAEAANAWLRNRLQ
jgi:hypothetical protein